MAETPMHCALCGYKGPDLSGHMHSKHPIVGMLESIGRPNQPLCPRAKSYMTPCIINDGANAVDDRGECVGCGYKPIDPGNEPSKPKPHTLEWVMDFVRRHPGATTGQGEADLLVAEIDRLRKELEGMIPVPDNYMPSDNGGEPAA